MRPNYDKILGRAAKIIEDQYQEHFQDTMYEQYGDSDAEVLQIGRECVEILIGQTQDMIKIGWGGDPVVVPDFFVEDTEKASQYVADRLSKVVKSKSE